MCGAIRLEGRKDKLLVRGQRVPMTNLEADKGAFRAEGYVWDGHARSDGSVYAKGRTLKQQWLDRGFEPATIKGVDMFTERSKLPDGAMQTTEINLRCRAEIGALINRETGQLVILTRPARTELERSAHHRFPVYVKDRQQLIAAINKRFPESSCLMRSASS